MVRARYTQAEMRAAVRRARAHTRAACNARAYGESKAFAKREADYLASLPPRKRARLMAQTHCGLVPESDRPRRRVTMPNGHVLQTTWYKVPTSDTDATLALREQRWLIANGG